MQQSFKVEWCPSRYQRQSVKIFTKFSPSEEPLKWLHPSSFSSSIEMIYFFMPDYLLLLTAESDEEGGRCSLQFDSLKTYKSINTKAFISATYTHFQILLKINIDAFLPEPGIDMDEQGGSSHCTKNTPNNTNASDTFTVKGTS